MDILTVAGLVLGMIAIVGGAIAKGAGVGALLNVAAFLIVFVGTAAAVMVHNGKSNARRAMQIFRWVIKPPVSDGKALVGQIVEWSNVARKQGLLGLEPQVDQQSDPFLKKGLQMLVDGIEPEAIRHMLEIELGAQEHYDQNAARFWEGAGIYSPTLGIIGAVLGLMAVMKNLADPSKLGMGIAAAFTATIYGIGLANLFLLPVAAKLKAIIAQRTAEREMIIEGLVAIAQGENPRNIESRLAGFLHH
ncbi:MAG: flagellar motor protein [Pseudomonadota bacterium]